MLHLRNNKCALSKEYKKVRCRLKIFSVHAQLSKRYMINQRPLIKSMY